MIASPIIVTGLPKSGTSIVTGSIAAHGVWTGMCRPARSQNPKGFFENRRLTKLANSEELRRMGRSAFERAVQEILMKERYKGGPWVFKLPVSTNWYIWDRLSPLWVVVRRPYNKVLDSHKRIGLSYSPTDHIEHKSILWDMVCSCKAMIADPNAIVNGNYTGLDRVLAAIDIRMRTDIMSEFVIKEIWHAN